MHSKLKLSNENVYALGVYFSYDEELATKRNFFEKLPKLKKILNIWSSRDISIYGRVNIVKTLAISKLTFICSVLDTQKRFTDEVNNIIFDYIWKYKNPKLEKPLSSKIRGMEDLRADPCKNRTKSQIFGKA